MYVSTAEGLGFSLKPPKWLRNAVTGLVKQTHVSVPTPAGPVIYDLGNPADVAAMKAIAAGTKLSVGPREPTTMESVQDAVSSVPSWVWWAGGGAAALFLLPKLMPRARRNPHRRRRRG